MRIAFATLAGTRDPSRGSGTFYFLARELEQQGHEVEHVGPVDYSDRPWLSQGLQRLARLSGKRYRAFQDVLVARRIGAWVAAELESSRAEVLLTNDYSIAGFTASPRPIALFTDSVFPRRYRGQPHPWLNGIWRPNVLSCQYVTRRGLRRARLWAFPSDWAVSQALSYGVRGGRSRVERIEFGANLFEPPPAEIAASRSFAKVASRGRLRVLFVGNRDWQLKGGNVAVEVVRELRARGHEATLDVVGAQPPTSVTERWVIRHGVIDKRSDPRRLSQLYEGSDVLLVPSRAEGFGVTFVEAAAHGLPSLSFDSETGVSCAIRHQTTGLLLPLDSSPLAFVDAITGWLEEPSEYDRLVVGSRRFYEAVANWPQAAERLVQAISARI